MKILLLGATGRTGKQVLSIALQEGYMVSCLARNTRRIEPHTNLSIFEGDPTKQLDLEKAIYGCKSIISVLNISRTSDFPWAPLQTP